MMPLPYVGFLLLAYFMGAIPFGVIIARSKGVDLRQRGSGNIGATNVGRVLGRRFGYVCFLLDCGKGFVPVLAAGLWLRRQGAGLEPAQQAAWLAVALLAVLGHMFSVFVGFRGGKGVATSLGVVLGFYPFFTFAGLAAFGVWIIVVLIWRYVSLASIVAAVALPLFFVWFSTLLHWPLLQHWPLLAFIVLMALLVVFRHRSNIRRLLTGTENKIGTKKNS